jgi:hypothetical protein
MLKPEYDDRSPYEIFSLLQNEFGALEIANVPRFEPEFEPEPELMVVPKTDTLTRARSREPVYDPISLESECDYFLTPKPRRVLPILTVNEAETADIVAHENHPQMGHDTFVGIVYQMLIRVQGFNAR